jgi:hypothetical protein
MAIVRGKYLVVILTIAACVLVGTTFAAITVNQNLASSGTIQTGPNIGVYSNSACTLAMTSLNWGTIQAGSSATVTLYIEDTGGSQMAPSITVSNWNPSTASNYITIAWTTLPSEIQPGISGAIAVTLTLTVSSTITGITSFTNSITVSGTG